MRWLALVGLIGCGDVFDLEKVGPADDARIVMDAPADAAVPVCFTDDFDGTALSPSWTSWGPLGLDVTGSHLVMSIPANTLMMDGPYGGVSLDPRNLTGITAELELVDIPAGPIEVAMQLTLDGMNAYSFSVGPDTLEVNEVVAGAATKRSTTYIPDMHRFIRLQHDAVANEMIYLARGSTSEPWTELTRYPADVALTHMYFEIYAGSYNPSSPTTTSIDSVRLYGTCPL